MKPKKAYTIYQRSDGKWVSKRGDRLAASSVHASRTEAEHFARVMLEVFGGGELIIRQAAATSGSK